MDDADGGDGEGGGRYQQCRVLFVIFICFFLAP